MILHLPLDSKHKYDHLCFSDYFRSKQIDHRTQRDRLELETSNWEIQMLELTNAYLDFQYRAGENLQPANVALVDTVDSIQVIDLFCES
jgi:hypothetical protein